MKSLDIINNAIKKEKEVCKYGLMNTNPFSMEDLEIIERDLEMLESFNKMHHDIILSKKELYDLLKWLEEQEWQ